MNIITLTAFEHELALSKKAGVMDDAAKEESRLLAKHPHLVAHTTPEAQLGHYLTKGPARKATQAYGTGAVRRAATAVAKHL